MKDCLRRLPIPTGCVALGFIGLASLLKPYGLGFCQLFSAVAALLLLLVLLKLCLPGELRAACAELLPLSLLAGSAMTGMLLAAQLKTLLHAGWAVWIWAASLIGHLAILLLFSLRLLQKRPGLRAVRGCWLLVYVGIAAAAISAPAFGMQTVGRILLIPAGLGVLILLPMVLWADRQETEMPAWQRPLFCISSAPVSIWLVGWLSVSAAPAHLPAAVLALAAQLFYFPALWRCLKTIRGPFVPAFAAFTFPFVITATALGRTLQVLSVAAAWRPLFIAELLIALALCLYVLVRYIIEFVRRADAE